MKKLTALLMSSLMLLTACSFSEKDAATAEIITGEGKKTVPLVNMLVDAPWMGTNLRAVLNEVPGSGRDFWVEFEVLTTEEPERSNRLTRIRTEMMAGKGPDLFVVDMAWSCSSRSQNSGELLDPVFRFPERSMDNRLFLPLDEYMEKGRTDYSAFCPGLMEVCRNGEGQQLLPLTYYIDAASFRKGAYDIPGDCTSSQQAMLESGVPILEYYASSVRVLPLGYFGRDADYEKEELTFTEEELFEQELIWFEHLTRFEEGYYKDILDTDSFSMGAFVAADAEFLTVPARNRDGGVTAYVALAGAVNRNSSCPEYAFQVLDKLAGEDVMRAEGLYNWSGGIVANTGLGGPDKPIFWIQMDKESYSEYLEILDQVTVFKLPSSLEQAIDETFFVPFFNGELKDEEDVRAAAHKGCTTMTMMLTES